MGEVRGVWAMFVRSPVGGMVAGFLGNVERKDAESRARLQVGSVRCRRESMEHVCDEGCEKECVLITEAEKSRILVVLSGAWKKFVILQCVVVSIIWFAGTIMS